MKDLWLTAWLVVLASHAIQAADLFNLDQRYGSIAFSVTNFGAFSSLGSFPRFMGELLIDRSDPEQTNRFPYRSRACWPPVWGAAGRSYP
jgi:hypothetical protein